MKYLSLSKKMQFNADVGLADWLLLKIISTKRYVLKSSSSNLKDLLNIN